MRPGRAMLPVLVLSVLTTAGCTDDGGPRFDAEGGRDVPCMVHQEEAPGTRYTDPERRNTAEVLMVLRYYVANGRKPYCDGAGPTEVDRAWVEFYLSQGADRSRVEPLLGD